MAALAAGNTVDVSVNPRGIAADSLGVRQLGIRVFGLVQSRVSQAILVSDDEIAAAQDYLWETLRVAAEPGARRRLLQYRRAGRYRCRANDCSSY
jgi:threonine dehydratase